jgi:hypothetical protein
MALIPALTVPALSVLAVHYPDRFARYPVYRHRRRRGYRPKDLAPPHSAKAEFLMHVMSDSFLFLSTNGKVITCLLDFDIMHKFQHAPSSSARQQRLSPYGKEMRREHRLRQTRTI